MADINVFSPKGELGTIDDSQMGSAMQQGYVRASPEDIRNYDLQKKHGSLGQQAIAGLEAVGRGATFGLSTAAETALGVSPEDIAGREEANPLTAGVGEAVGLIGSELTGVGEGALLAKAGEAAATQFAKKTLASKIGSTAAKYAVENAIVQSGSEIHKLTLDPNQSVQTSIADIGLSALIGGGLGGLGRGMSEGANKLWSATKATKLGQALEMYKSGVNGEMPKVVPESVGELVDAYAPSANPEIKAYLSGNPELAQKMGVLLESQNKAGIEARTSLDAFKSEVKNTVTEKMGLTPEQLNSFKDVSENDVGNKIKAKLKDAIEQKYAPINEAYKDIESKFNSVELSIDDKKAIADALNKASLDNKYYIDPESTASKVIEKFNKSLDNMKNIDDFRVHKSNVLNPLFANPETKSIAGAISKNLNEVESALIDNSFGTEELAQYSGLKAQYKEAKQFIDELGSRLSLGKVKGERGIMSSMDLKLDGEDFLRRLNPSKSVELNQFLERNLPEVHKDVIDYHRLKVLDSSLKDSALDLSKLKNKIDNLSPEFRESLFSPEQLKHVDASNELLSKLPTRLNPSGSAGVLSKMLKGGASNIGMIAGSLSGHGLIGGALGYAAGLLGSHLQHEALPGLDLALLKYAGSNGAIDSAGFNAMSKYFSAVKKADAVFNNGVKALVTGGEVLSSKLIPDKHEIDKLAKQVEDYSQNPQKMLDINHPAATYLDDHAIAASGTISNSINYLSSIRPKTIQQNPLDKPHPPSAAAEHEYRKQLEIAQQPAMILKHMADGSLTSKEVATFKQLYPNLYQGINRRILEQLTEKPEVPYKQRLGMAMFMGRPLDSTMTPQALQFTQGSFAVQQQQRNAGSGLNKIKNLHKNEQSATDKIERP